MVTSVVFVFQSNHFYNKLNEILDMVSKGNDSPGTLRKSNNYTPMTVFDIQYPELYVYWQRTGGNKWATSWELCDQVRLKLACSATETS